MQLCQPIEGRDWLEGHWFIYLICHCVPWRQHFIMYTGKVSVVTTPCHLGRHCVYSTNDPLSFPSDLHIAPVF